MKQFEHKMRDIKTRIQRESRMSYWKHVETIISLNKVDTNEYCVMKRFWSFIKYRRTDKVGVASPKKDGRTISDPQVGS